MPMSAQFFLAVSFVWKSPTPPLNAPQYKIIIIFQEDRQQQQETEHEQKIRKPLNFVYSADGGPNYRFKTMRKFLGLYLVAQFAYLNNNSYSYLNNNSLFKQKLRFFLSFR